MRFWALFLFFILATNQLEANDHNDLHIPSLKSLRPMNDINPGDYDNFWENWPLVTTRYRADNGEQRFVYANKIAYEAMKNGSLEFPEGSVFAKVAFAAEEDVHFPNSLEPIDFTRLQLMVKDSDKYKETNGWGYWLYVDNVKDNPKNDPQKIAACHACHTIVKDKDYVFATPTFMGKTANWYNKVGRKFEDFFRTRSSAQLNKFEKEVVKLLPNQPEQVQSLRMRLFLGSLYESIGPLSSFAGEDDSYLLVDPVEKRFLAVQALPPTKECDERAMVFMNRKKKKKEKGTKRVVKYIMKGIVCDGENKWVKSFPMPKTMM